jgi:hypothetical protein
MFFRRHEPKQLTFEDRLANVRQAGFKASDTGSAVRVSRAAYGVDLSNRDGKITSSGQVGVLIGDEIASLVDGGFQKFFRSPSGKTKPATAEELYGLHDFQEDLKEALGQESYYNESLGTVSTYYIYDRVKDRDRGVPKRACEQATSSASADS